MKPRTACKNYLTQSLGQVAFARPMAQLREDRGYPGMGDV